MCVPISFLFHDLCLPLRLFFVPKHPNSSNFRNSSKSTDFPGLRDLPAFGRFSPNFCILILQFLSLHRPLIHPHVQRAFGLGAQKITVQTVQQLNVSISFFFCVSSKYVHFISAQKVPVLVMA